MIRYRLAIAVVSTMLASGVLYSVAAQEGAKADAEQATPQQDVSDTEFSERLLSLADEEANDRSANDKGQEGERREKDGDRDRGEERDGDEGRERHQDRRRERPRDVERESGERERQEVERESDERERQNRVRAEREHDEFERHVDTMRQEIKELAKLGRKDQAEQLERELHEQMEAFYRRHADRPTEEHREENLHERIERVHEAVQLLREAAGYLRAAGIGEPADEIVAISDRIAHHAPGELQERRDREEQLRHRQNEAARSGEQHGVRELKEVLSSQNNRIHEVETQVKELRLLLQSLQRNRESQ
jgi:hypothetical protein